jgi:hypothetical protein
VAIEFTSMDGSCKNYRFSSLFGRTFSYFELFEIICSTKHLGILLFVCHLWEVTTKKTASSVNFSAVKIQSAAYFEQL